TCRCPSTPGKTKRWRRLLTSTLAIVRKGRKIDVSARRTRSGPAGTRTRRARCRRQQPFALGALARHLAGAAHGFRLLARPLLRRLLVVSAHLHLSEDPLALHLLLERAKLLI